MIFTHPGKLGDVFQCLQIISWWCKENNSPAKLALTRFPYSKECEELLLMQGCISEVIHLPFEAPATFNNHLIDMKSLGYNEDYINLGFSTLPKIYYCDHIANELGLGVDYDFKLNIGEKRNKYRGKTAIIDKYENNILRNSGIKGEYLPSNNSLLKNLQLAMGASTVKTFSTASAMLLLLAGKNLVVYGENRMTNDGRTFKDLHIECVYSKLPGKATWVTL